MRYVKRLRKPLRHGSQICIGIDPSLSGHAISILENGKLKKAIGWTDKKTLQKLNGGTLCWLKLPSGRTEPNSQFRMRTLHDWTVNVISDYEFYGVTVAIEGYAYSKRSRGLHEIHGLVEGIKQELFTRRIPFRVYDPLSVKLAWAGHGGADKEMMQDACLEHFGTRFDKEGSAGENLADATLVAGLLHTELEVRAGRLLLEHLDGNMRRVMLRTTRSEPEAIISREFITPSAVTAKEPILAVEN